MQLWAHWRSVTRRSSHMGQILYDQCSRSIASPFRLLAPARLANPWLQPERFLPEFIAMLVIQPRVGS